MGSEHFLLPANHKEIFFKKITFILLLIITYQYPEGLHLQFSIYQN